MTCRVCGKAYEPCRTANRNPKVFHWQEVACSPECGAIYLQRIVESRKPADAPKKSKRKKDTPRIETESVVIEPSLAIAEAETADVTIDAPSEVE